MLAFYYAMISLSLGIMQTALMPLLGLSAGAYDLLLILVVYVGLLRPLKESLPVILCLGLLSGGLSGGHVALFLTAYLWLFCVIKGLTQIIHIGFHLLLPAVFCLAVVIENGIIWTLIQIPQPAYRTTEPIIGLMGVQMVWIVITGPPAFYLIRRGHAALEAWQLKVRGDKREAL